MNQPIDGDVGHSHKCPGCDVEWECEETECPEDYECPACHAETKGIDPPSDIDGDGDEVKDQVMNKSVVKRLAAQQGDEMENTNRFQWILDTVPQWWDELTNVQINVGTYIALIPGAEPALPGDWIIQEPGGSIRTESCEEGRVRARAMLIKMRKEIAAQMFAKRKNLAGEGNSK